MTPPAALVGDTLAAVALASLPGCGHRRLGALLRTQPDGSPGELWAALLDGRLLSDEAAHDAVGRRGGTRLLARWREQALEVDLGRLGDHLARAGVSATWRGAADYPARLADDPEPPVVVFRTGHPDALAALDADLPSVAIVGTRRCTGYGLDVARQLGRDLAATGVVVVSGLALGIDGAAHEGALAGAGAGRGARPVAVVGSGLDVVYPPRHRPLWRRVAEEGCLLSEAPLGAAPEAWRFPLRNRVIAGLADVVVVVESHATGGSLSTVRAAIERGVPVMAVPGSVRSPSSAGTNRLLADGVAPVVDADDVLVALSLAGRRPAIRPSRREAPVEVEGSAARELDECTALVLTSVDWTPSATEEIVRRTGLPVAEVVVALTRLEVRGLARRVPGGWWERCGTAG